LPSNRHPHGTQNPDQATTRLRTQHAYDLALQAAAMADELQRIPTLEAA
jgi:hypothetical protein